MELSKAFPHLLVTSQYHAIRILSLIVKLSMHSPKLLNCAYVLTFPLTFPLLHPPSPLLKHL